MCSVSHEEMRYVIDCYWYLSLAELEYTVHNTGVGVRTRLFGTSLVARNAVCNSHVPMSV